MKTELEKQQEKLRIILKFLFNKVNENLVPKCLEACNTRIKRYKKEYNINI